MVAILTLALGIGATTTVFSVADPLLRRPLPVRDPADLVLLRTINPSDPAGHDRVPQELYDRLRADSATLETVLGSFGFPPFVRIMAPEGEVPDVSADRVRVEPVTGTYFPSLGVGASLGRLISESDDRPDAPLVAVISHGLWMQRFGGGVDVLGAAVRLVDTRQSSNEEPQVATVVGVAAPSFRGTDLDVAADLWLPFESFKASSGLAGEGRLTGGINGLRVMGRRRAGVSMDEVQSEVEVLAASLTERTLAIDRFDDVSVQVEAGAGGYSDLRLHFADPLLAMTFAVGLVLLIACANVAGLMLTRATSRRHDTAVRIALGGGRGVLLRELIAEGLILSGAGGVLSLVLAGLGMRLLSTYLPSDTGVLAGLGLDSRIVVFTVGVSLLTAILFSVLPFVRLPSVNLASVLQGAGGGGSRSASPFRGGRLIVGLQVGLSLLLLVVASLLLRSLHELRAADVGFDGRSILELTIEAPIGDAMFTFMGSALTSLEALPEVESATVFGIEGLLAGEPALMEIRSRGAPVAVSRVQAGVGFFETLRIRIIAGRSFTEPETRPMTPELMGLENADEPGPIIVSESLSRFLFGDGDAVGQRVQWAWAGEPGERESVVVGVAADVTHVSVREDRSWTVYTPVSAVPALTRFGLRTTGDAADLKPAVRTTVESFDDRVRVSRLLTLWEAREASIVQERFLGNLVSVFSLIALLLAAIGLYGLLSYSAAQRTREIGVRMALGARTRDVARLLVGDMARVVVSGALAGLTCALVATRLITRFLYGVTPMDPVSVAAAVGILLAVCLVAAYLPVRRASRVNPIVALRHD